MNRRCVYIIIYIHVIYSKHGYQSGPKQEDFLCLSLTMCTLIVVHCRGFESHPRRLIFLRKVTALGVLCWLSCLYDLACFFLPSASPLTCIYIYIYIYTCMGHQLGFLPPLSDSDPECV